MHTMDSRAEAVITPASLTTASFDAPGFLARLEGFLRGQHGLGAALGWTAEQLASVEALGDQLLAAGRPSDALVLYEGVLALDPIRPTIWPRLAVCYDQAGDQPRSGLCLEAARDLLGETSELATLRRLLARPGRRPTQR